MFRIYESCRLCFHITYLYNLSLSYTVSIDVVNKLRYILLILHFFFKRIPLNLIMLMFEFLLIDFRFVFNLNLCASLAKRKVNYPLQ